MFGFLPTKIDKTKSYLNGGSFFIHKNAAMRKIATPKADGEQRIKP